MKPAQFGKLGSKLALTFIALGLLAIALGYNGAAGNIAVAAQLPYIVSGGAAGVSLVVIGAALMITQAAREDRQRLEGLLMQLVDAQQAGGTGIGQVPSDVDGLFAAGTASYHVPGCRLVDGREEVSYLTAAEATARDLKPCRVCQPESTNVTVR
ncbi:MAG: hypothetical protein QOE84_2492 [Actinomycetota bacterium]|jgi:uncharacterized protein (DUF58 family)|nr:hypothetical protein [Actinomycetota bacterium]